MKCILVVCLAVVCVSLSVAIRKPNRPPPIHTPVHQLHSFPSTLHRSRRDASHSTEEENLVLASNENSKYEDFNSDYSNLKITKPITGDGGDYVEDYDRQQF